MAQNWPVGVNTDALTNVADQRQNARQRSPMDSGPPIVRRRFTAALNNVDIPMIMTNTEKVLFDEWYITTVLEGSLSFLFPDPTTGDLMEYRFRGEDAPAFAGENGSENDDIKRWSVTLQLERLP